MKQIIYLVRHAEPNYNNHNDFDRELTSKGLQDCQLITDFFKDTAINAIYSSPFKRAVQTITPLAKAKNLPIQLNSDFRERKIDNHWIDDFNAFTTKQWEDFNYKLTQGESLQEVQDRAIQQLKQVLSTEEPVIAISSHGTTISTILNYYDNNFGLSDFQMIKTVMPFIATLTFEHQKLISLTLTNPFTNTLIYQKRS